VIAKLAAILDRDLGPHVGSLMSATIEEKKQEDQQKSRHVCQPQLTFRLHANLHKDRKSVRQCKAEVPSLIPTYPDFAFSSRDSPGEKNVDVRVSI